MTSLPVLLLALLGSPVSQAAPDKDPTSRPRPARSTQDKDDKRPKKPKSSKPRADKPKASPPSQGNKPRSDSSDKPRPQADKPRPQADKPRPQADKPRSEGTRNPPPRDGGDRPATPPRQDGDRPGAGDRPQDGRPPQSDGERPPQGGERAPDSGKDRPPTQGGERGAQGTRPQERPRTDGPVGRTPPAEGEDARMPRSADRAETQRRADRHVRQPANEASRRPPENARRSYDGGSRSRQRPPHRTRSDHRYHRPNHRYVRRHPRAHRPPPRYRHYRHWYTRWYVHPYYRHRYATRAVVWLNFSVNPWVVTWAPPVRSGWTWIPGYWRGPVWVPGHWQPARHVAPRAGYVWVPGWWMGSVYVDGYWRVQDRPASTNSRGEVTNEWEWSEGYYLEDGTFVQGHWRPTGGPPQAGYSWEPGFWDGDDYVDGFWRPEQRSGYTWVSAYYDEDGVYQSGYWLPIEEQDGFVWVPGWFDGNEWVQGHWVRQAEYDAADLDEWQPSEGYDDGWDVEGWGDGAVESYSTADGADTDEIPLGLPVYFDDEE